MEKRSRDAELAEKRRYWEKQIQRWQESGLSQKQYCQQNNLTQHQLTYWKKRFVKPESSISFVELQIAGNVQPGSGLARRSALRLTIGSEYQIDVDRGFDPVVLQQLIYVLRKI